MKKVLIALSLGLFVSVQAQKLPQPSPHCKVEQTVGLTDITLDYSRPGVKDRAIFGELVPYDKVWRFGANMNTLITFSTDVKIAGKDLKAGTYSMFAIPSKESSWMIAFNTDIEQWGAESYNEEKNALIVKIKPESSSFHETFTIEINSITNNSASITMVWDKTRINIPIELDTDAQAIKNIEEAIKKGEELEKVYYNAARYYFGSLKKKEDAMSYVERSLKTKETHNCYFLKAQILLDSNKKDEAIEAATKAYDLAVKAGSKGWANYIEGTLKEWKEK